MSISRRSFALGTALAAPAILSRPAGAAEFNWKFATNQPLTHPSNTRVQEAIDRIRTESNGRIALTLFPNSQLGGDTDMFSQLRAGAIHIFLLSGLIVQSVVPEAGANGVGFAFKDYDTVWAAMDGEFGAYLRRKMDAAGLHAFPKIWDNGFRQMTSSRGPIRSPDDLAGMKIRIPVMQIESSLFESLGASPTTINIKEAYSALQTKLVDGQENPLAIIQTFKLYDVQKYCSFTSHIWDGFWAIGNARALGRLPAELQEIVSRNIDLAAAAQRIDVRHLNDSLQAEIEKEGMIFNTPDPEPFRVKLRQSGFYQKWQTAFGPECWGLLEKYTGTLA
ncbi:MAG: TRAP transporter substrate-binding protein [Acetobacteraceae bacterium]